VCPLQSPLTARIRDRETSKVLSDDQALADNRSIRPVSLASQTVKTFEVLLAAECASDSVPRSVSAGRS